MAEVVVYRSTASVSASHRFHFCRSEIFILSLSFCLPFLAFCLFVVFFGCGLLLVFCFGVFFWKKEMGKRKPKGTTYARISLLLLHHTTSVIMAHVNMTGIKIRVMRISSGGSSQRTSSEVQFEKNCLWILAIKPSTRGFGQKQLA